MWASGSYFPRAGERIYRDFIYGIYPSGVAITLYGLGVNRDCNITIWAYDTCSVGEVNRVANWYGNGTYLFDTNFIGGSAGWPDYNAVAPEDLYKYAFSGRATTDYLGRIILTSYRDPLSLSGQPFAFINALQVEPNVSVPFVETKYAQRPVPFDGTQSVPVNTVLKWRKGGGISKHDLYLGTDFDDVNNATRTSHPELLIYEPNLPVDANAGYDPLGATGFLALDTTYYWRVDEVNGAPDYTVLKGDIWSFETLAYSVVDDFDSYIDDAALKAVWKDYWVNGTSAEVFLEQKIVHRCFQLMNYEYYNNAESPFIHIRGICGIDFAEPTIIYVDAKATGANNGSSWADAFKYLQDALTTAEPNCEIRVAQGIYKPDANWAYPNGSGDSNATFELLKGVTIKGGYAGFGEPDPNARDIKGNDRQPFDPLIFDPCRAENSYHVVKGIDVDNTAILDGFTVTNGYAYGGGTHDNRGGGMHNYFSSPKVRNCIFKNNEADIVASGGGICNSHSSPEVTNCLFRNNFAGSGGGMYNWFNSNPVVTNCTFVANWNLGGGGGIDDSIGSASSVVKNCILWGNEGGQISVDPNNVNYSCIQDWPSYGNNIGIGNINADPMFAEDGYHLKLCSPCIDTGYPNYMALPGETDIDGKERIMDGNCDGKIVVDMGADEYYLKDCNVMLRAHCPRPDCRAANVLRDVVLSWKPGLFANKHDVYFGTDRIAVINANDPNTPPGRGRRDSTCFDPCTSLLNFDATYYWRIDEVNDANIWQGDLWNFRAGADDVISVCGEPPYQSMKFQYENYTYEPYYSEAEATIGTGDYDLKIDPNWLGMGAKALSLWFYGDPCNPVDQHDKMYIKLVDSDTPDHNATVFYSDYGDMTDLRETIWHEWNIPLTDFTSADPNFNLRKIKNVIIGFGDGTQAARDGIIYFDDIRLYITRCVPEMVEGDVDGNCAVDFKDFAIIANKWLDIGCCEDLYKDDKVDFRDFAILADSWLREGMLP
jgi:hypothetical protein